MATALSEVLNSAINYNNSAVERERDAVTRRRIADDNAKAAVEKWDALHSQFVEMLSSPDNAAFRASKIGQALTHVCPEPIPVVGVDPAKPGCDSTVVHVFDKHDFLPLQPQFTVFSKDISEGSVHYLGTMLGTMTLRRRILGEWPSTTLPELRSFIESIDPTPEPEPPTLLQECPADVKAGLDALSVGDDGNPNWFKPADGLYHSAVILLNAGVDAETTIAVLSNAYHVGTSQYGG